jgi:hypothetical protein
VPAGEAVAREDLAAARTRHPQDVLEVWGRGRRRADGRRVQGATHEGDGEHPGHARAHLERHRVDVVVWDRVADQVNHRAKHERAERRPGRRPGQSTSGDVQQDDHACSLVQEATPRSRSRRTKVVA